MAQLRILSWNVETFGETKGGLAINFISRVISHYRANMVLFLETTKTGHAIVIHELLHSLNPAQNWVPFASEIAGKAYELPPTVSYAKNKPHLETRWLNEFFGFLSGCYDLDAPNKQLVLKPPAQWQNVDGVIMALEYSGAVRPDYETYTGIIQADPAVSSQYRLIMPNSYFGMLPLDSRLVSTDGAGQEIGYQNPQSTFNGRSPYMIQMIYANSANLSLNSRYFPLVSFHAPFGDNLSLRVEALNGLLRLWTKVDDVTVADMQYAPIAMISGDFNLTYGIGIQCPQPPAPIPPSANSTIRAYCPFIRNGFSILMGEKSSLTTIKEADKANARVNWTNSDDYLVNAYDNMMVKGAPLERASEDPEIIDLLTDIYNSAIAPGNYLSGAIPNAITSMYDAFVYYRTNISDHLPALSNFEVIDRP